MLNQTQVKETMSLVALAQDIKNVKADEIRDGLVSIKKLQAELKEAYDLFEAEALVRNIASKWLVEKEMKFEIIPGNAKTEYDAVKIGMSLPLYKFVEIVTVVDGKAKKVLTDEEYKIVEASKTVTPSDKMIVSVSKMTKAELVEAKVKG